MRRVGRLIVAIGLAGIFVPTAGGRSVPDLLPADNSSSTGATQTKTVTRTHLVNGADQVADSRNVSVTVSQTTDLRSQRVQVTWTGAHPSGYIYPDPNSTDARNEEYPMLLIECRGVSDDPSLPVQDRLSPQTCWSQNPSRERYQETNNNNALFPPYRLDRYATPADRQAIVGDPTACVSGFAPVSHRIPFVGADGTVFPGGCAGDAPEAGGGTTTDADPGNTTYAATRADGTGGALFTVWTNDDNASLGCSSTVPCSLVAVPIMGISCDASASSLPAADQPSNYTDSQGNSQEAAAATTCMANGKSGVGSTAGGQVDQETNLSVTGALWWSESNWRNRIVFPLSFVPDASQCSLQGNLPQAQVYGSELMVGATQQWAPAICSAGQYSLNHVQTGEPQARNLLTTGNIDAGFTVNGADGGYASPTVNAPSAVTGFSIAYVIDDKQGDRYQSLKLDARLLAKLLTESYTDNSVIADEDSALAGNPLNIALDPEFIALNPSLAGVLDKDTLLDPTSLASIIFPSSPSDVMYALTSYIAADPEARAWIAGAPDPWGMHVNPAYKTDLSAANPDAPLTLPTYTWPLLDTFIPPGLAAPGSPNECYHDDPEPIQALIASPTIRLENITQDLIIAKESSSLSCVNADTAAEKLASSGRQPVGQRFLLGIMPLADVDRYQLDSAALETSTAPSAVAKFTDASNRTFVTPTDDSLLAAARTATPDQNAGVWTISAANLRSSYPSAYPGTMIVSTAVHTQGVDAADAKNFAALLTFIAGDAQIPGNANGQLADGYVPISDADGLGALHAYTLAAASAVGNQAGVVPPLVSQAAAPQTTGSPAGGQTRGQTSQTATVQGAAATSSAPATTASGPSPTAESSGSSAASSASPQAAAGTVGSTGTTVASPDHAAAQGPSSAGVTIAGPLAAAPQAPALAAARTADTPVGSAGLIFPLLLLAAALCGIAAAGIVLRGRRG